MNKLHSPLDSLITLADLLAYLGDISPERVRLQPAPGTATEEDVLELNDRENRLFELVDGVLVEKAMGFRESLLAVAIIEILKPFVRTHRLGLVTAPDGMMRLGTRLVRIPDVSFISWQQIPGGRVPNKPIPDLYPDLAVEVLSKKNTRKEMERKRKEYFAAGTRLAWMVDPKKRTVAVYTSATQFTTLTEADTLEGGDVLPGFHLPVVQLFAELDQQAPEDPVEPIEGA